MALYIKAGGTPYKLLADVIVTSPTAYISPAYGIRDARRLGHGFVVCCSQLLDDRGGGLEWLPPT